MDLAGVAHRLCADWLPALASLERHGDSGRDSAAWPMAGVSLLYSIAYAFSITRYKLMQVEEIINRSVVYFASA